MKLTTYVLLMFSISAIFYLTGSETFFNSLWGANGTAQDASTVYAIFYGAIFVVGGLLLAGAIFNFSSFFIIPMLLAFGVLNALAIPTDLLVGADTPGFVKLFTIGFFNILLLMTIYDEVRGR